MRALMLLLLALFLSVCVAAFVTSAPGARVEAAKSENLGLVRTPAGIVHESCVHAIPDDSHVIDSEHGARVITPNGEQYDIPKCTHRTLAPLPRRASGSNHNASSSGSLKAFAGGWQAWTTYETTGKTFTEFTGVFTVPKAPAQYSGQLLYTFTGLQNLNWVPGPNSGPAPPGFDIIQPVLQFGASPAGGGQYWALASWYVTLDGGYLFSPLKQVTPAQNIFGNMTMTGPDTWFILGQVVGSQQSTTKITVTRPRLVTQPWAYCTLEVYTDSGDCSNYPSNTLVFTKLQLMADGKAVTPNWTAHKSVSPICNEHAQVVSPSSVTIVF